MFLPFLPWLGLAFQVAGAVVLAVSGGFGLGVRKFSPRGTALGLALFCAGCVFMAAYAASESNFLLTAAQLVAAALIGFGVARKARDRRDG